MNGYEVRLKKLLAQHGYSCLRSGKGSHEIWAKDGCNPQTVPKDCKSRHLANVILKNCNISHRF